VLYHKYTGHDNNRDAFMTTMLESQYVAKILFRDWVPQAYVDHHHMGSYGARIYIPPYAEPIRPMADPLIWREHSWFGAHMTYHLEEAGKTGVLSGAQFLAWGHLSQKIIIVPSLDLVVVRNGVPWQVPDDWNDGDFLRPVLDSIKGE
jgi:hypothetical protein